MNIFSNNKKKILSLIILAAVAVGVFTVRYFSYAADTPTEPPLSEFWATIFGTILYILVYTVGAVLELATEIMIKIGSFNNFIREPAVIAGWQVVRDVCNNFFIVILLIIAVGTILRISNYEYKSLLPRLLIMAVMINFSKTIVGVLIDISQIIMLSFASAINVDGKNLLLVTIGIPAFLNFDRKATIDALQNGQGIGMSDVIAGMIIALVVGVVAIVCVLAIAIILAYRIVMLWFLIILSPIAFIGSVLPRTKSYASEWWGDLTKYLMVGPVMLFFLYISFFTMIKINENRTNWSGIGFSDSASTVQQGTTIGLSEAATVSNLFNVMIVVGLMVGSLIMGQRSGVAGAKWAGSAMGKLQSWGKKPINFGKAAAIGTAKVVAKTGGEMVKGAAKGAESMVVGSLLSSKSSAVQKVGKAIRGVQNKYGATGASVGATLGAGALGIPGAVAGGVGGAIVGGMVGWGVKGLSDRINRIRKVNNNRLKVDWDKDDGEFLDDNGHKVDVAGYDKNGLPVDKDGKSLADKIRKKWNASKGYHEEVIHNGKEFIPTAGMEMRDAQTNVVMTKNMVYSKFKHKGNLIKNNGEEAENREDADFEYDSKSDVYRKIDKRLRDANGVVKSRFQDYEDENGDKYRRKQKDGPSYKIDSQGNFETDENGREITAKDPFFGKTSAMGDWSKKFWAAYASATEKSVAAKDAAKDAKITELGKDYSTMSKEMLQQLLEVEGNGAKKAAIALTLGLKAGFKDYEQVLKAKEALGGNQLLLKKFNEEMNKRNMVMNNTRKDGTLDEGAIAKLISEGKAKWADQDSKSLNKESLNLMSKQLGTDFHKELEKMGKTDKDRDNIKKALMKDIDKRGFAGDDMNVRKSAAAFSGDWVKAFSDDRGNLRQQEIGAGVRKISKAEVFDSINDELLDLAAAADNIKEFQKELVNNLETSQISKMANSNDMSPEKLNKIIRLIHREATADANSKAAKLLKNIDDNPRLHEFADRDKYGV